MSEKAMNKERQLFDQWEEKHKSVEELHSKYFSVGSRLPIQRPERMLTEEALLELEQARQEEQDAWQAFVTAARR